MKQKKQKQKKEKKIQQLRCVIEHTNTFQYEDTDLVNLVSKSVLPEEIKADVLRQYDAGKEAYTAFVKERIVGTVNLWSPMPKIKLKKWSSAGKCVKTKVGSQIIELKRAQRKSFSVCQNGYSSKIMTQDRPGASNWKL